MKSWNDILNGNTNTSNTSGNFVKNTIKHNLKYNYIFVAMLGLLGVSCIGLLLLVSGAGIGWYMGITMGLYIPWMIFRDIKLFPDN